MPKKRDYKQELKTRKIRRRKRDPSDVNGTKKTVERNKARKILKLKVGDKREADHTKSLKKGGKTNKGNLKAINAKKNSAKGGKSGKRSTKGKKV